MLHALAFGCLSDLARRWKERTTWAGSGLRAFVVLLSLVALPARMAQAANPYLAASDDKPAPVRFTGTEWGDALERKERPISAQVITTRLAALPFASVFRIEFADVRAEGGASRSIATRHFVVTDSEIALLQDEDIDAAIARLKALAKAPTLPVPDLRAILRGQRKLTKDATSSSSLAVSGGRCTYRYAHNAGHFTTMVWQRGLGLVEYAQGRGAREDGFRLLRSVEKARGK